jgi:hypothetical protein
LIDITDKKNYDSLLNFIMSKDRKTHFDFIKNAPSRLSNSAIQKTPNKIGRSHRIFRDSDENFLSNSPSKKMDAS